MDNQSEKRTRVGEICRGSLSCHMGSGMALGIGAGVAIGVALDNIGLGIAVGVALGPGFAALFSARKKKK